MSVRVIRNRADWDALDKELHDRGDATAATEAAQPIELVFKDVLPLNAVFGLADVLKPGSGISALVLTDVTLPDVELGVLFSALASNKSVARLAIGCINDRGLLAMRVCALLRENTTLRELDVGRLADRSTDKLCRVRDFDRLAAGIASTSTLTTLTLRSIGMGAAGVRCLRDALARNTSITELDVSSNGFGDEGLDCIGDVLRENRTLIKLNVGDNGNRAAGLAALARAIRRNKVLQWLGLRRSYVGIEGLLMLADNATLTHIDMRGTRITLKGIQMLVPLRNVSRAATLTLDVRDNMFGAKHAELCALFDEQADHIVIMPPDASEPDAVEAREPDVVYVSESDSESESDSDDDADDADDYDDGDTDDESDDDSLNSELDASDDRTSDDESDASEAVDSELDADADADDHAAKRVCVEQRTRDERADDDTTV